MRQFEDVGFSFVFERTDGLPFSSPCTQDMMVVSSPIEEFVSYERIVAEELSSETCLNMLLYYLTIFVSLLLDS